MTDTETRRKNRARARREAKKAARKGDLFTGDAQKNLFAGTEYLNPARPRPELEPPRGTA